MVLLKRGHFILSGNINSGKSTGLSRFVSKLSGEGLLVAGVISMPRFDSGGKTGFELHILNRSKVCSVMELASVSERPGWCRFRRWYFDKNVFEKVNSFKFDNADIFVLDEIGPIELEEDGGLLPLARTVYGRYPTTITVVRRELKEAFGKRLFEWNGERPVELDVLEGIIDA